MFVPCAALALGGATTAALLAADASSAGSLAAASFAPLLAGSLVALVALASGGTGRAVREGALQAPRRSLRSRELETTVAAREYRALLDLVHQGDAALPALVLQALRLADARPGTPLARTARAAARRAAERLCARGRPADRARRLLNGADPLAGARTSPLLGARLGRRTDLDLRAPCAGGLSASTRDEDGAPLDDPSIDAAGS